MFGGGGRAAEAPRHATCLRFCHFARELAASSAMIGGGGRAEAEAPQAGGPTGRRGGGQPGRPVGILGERELDGMQSFRLVRLGAPQRGHLRSLLLLLLRVTLHNEMLFYVIW